MAAAANIDGQEKVIATAQQIIKSLATNKTAADDMLRILSGFDNRLSSIPALFPSSSLNNTNNTIDNYQQYDDQEDEQEDELLSDLDKISDLILRWDTTNANSNSETLFESTEVNNYLFAVDAVIRMAAESGHSENVYEPRAEILVQIAMARLEDEFRLLMIRNTVPLDAAGLHSSIRRLSLSFISDVDAEEGEFEVSNNEGGETPGWERERDRLSYSERNTDLIRPEAVADLKVIGDRMIAAEYEKELCQVYSSVRREILDECLSVLGVDRMSIEEVQRMEWSSLDDKMRKWIQAVKVVIRVLLSGERRLCDEVFSLSDELRDECFLESTKGCVMQLLNFGDAVAIGRRSSEKLFRILDMYEALSEVMVDLKALYGSGDFVVGEAEDILGRLGDAVKGTLVEFGNAVQKETSRKPMQGGEIHPLARYVMNYLKLLVDYSGALDTLLDDGGVDDDDSVESGVSETPLGRRLRLLISYLESNLEEKSKLYEDAALEFIFLMNNRLYIIQKVKDSELGTLLGDNWIRKRRGQVRQYHNSYLRASWTRALSFLRDDGFGGSGGSNSVSKMAIKDRFKNFNLAFEELYKAQTTWKVPDPQLREELRLSTSEKIVPAYRSFLGRFGGQLETSRHAAKYIKYTPEDLETHLMEFFEGSTVPSSHHPRRKLSSSS